SAVFFLFSSRRRHTRFSRDWSSDVCSSDLDKNMPGCAMAMARLDRPSVFVYGGTIQMGKNRRDVVSVFEAVGAHSAGKLSDIEQIGRASCRESGQSSRSAAILATQAAAESQ